MLRGSIITYLRLCILLPTIGVLATTQPVSAQNAFPPNFISSDVPHDVAAGSSADIQTLAVFAWNEFIALNWVAMEPATTGVRGRPDVTADFLSIKPDSDGNYPLLVWQTYLHKNEVFPASGTAPATFDSKGPTYDYSGQVNPASETTSFGLFNNLDEASEIGLATMYSHFGVGTGFRVLYEAKVNRALFDYLNGPTLSNSMRPAADAFTNCPGFDCAALFAAKTATTNDFPQFGGICSTNPSIVSLPCGDANVAGDDGEGAIEIKAAWRQLTPTELSSGRFYTRTVIYYTGGSGIPVYNNAVFGLVALHIIHKTRSFPTFVFATWEQVDNYDDATNQNTQDLAALNIPPPTASPPVTRNHLIHSQIQPINDAVHATFTAADPTTVWQYYKLIGVQAMPVAGPPMQPTDPSPPPLETDPLSYYFLANIMVETNQTLQNFFGTLDGNNMAAKKQNVYLNGAIGSPFQMGGCQGCHGTQGQSAGGDMSVIVSRAPYTSNSSPETSDADDATLRASADTRLYNPLPLEVAQPPPTKHRSHHSHHSSPPPDRNPW
jgi:hypothetical protein